MKKRLAVIWVGLAMLSAVAPAHAGLTYSFSTDQSVYNVSASSTFNVRVFLNEIGSPGDPFVLAPGGDGLFSTGVRLFYPASAPAMVLSGGDISGNPAFDNGPPPDTIATDVDNTIATAGFTQTVFANPVVHGEPVTGGYQLLLGTFTFTAGATPGSFGVTITRFNSGDNMVTGTNASLDGQISNATASINVVGSAVPEPSTLGMFATGMLLCLGYRWRCRRTAAA